MAVLDTGAAANLACYKWLDTHNSVLERRGLEKAVPYSSNARFNFGDGRIGDVKHATDIEVGIARCKSTLAAFVLDADIPALLRKGGVGCPGRPVGF